MQLFSYIENVPHRLLNDDRLHASHVSLYFALLLLHYRNKFTNPFVITRQELMHLSKVGSTRTYHRCIRDLILFGYIEYCPTYNSFIGTKVTLLSVEKE